MNTTFNSIYNIRNLDKRWNINNPTSSCKLPHPYRAALLHCFLLVMSTFANPSLSKAQCWEVDKILAPGGVLNDIFFLENNTTGWAVGPSIVFKTLDGGASWSPINTGVADNYNAVYFVDDETGWIVGDNGKIIKHDAIDGWMTQNSTGTTLNDVFFVNDQVGWAVGKSGMVLKTTNGGGIWNQQSTSFTNDFNAAYFFDSESGILVGGGGIIIRTSDGGATWQLDPPVTQSDLYGIYVNGNEGWCIGGTFIHTNDISNADWLVSGQPLEHLLKTIHAPDPQSIWALGEKGYIIKINNDTWTEWSNSPTILDIQSLFIVDSQLGWAVGVEGQLLKYTNAPPPCLNTIPLHQQVDVPTNTNITWPAVGGCLDGYFVNIGTAPGATDILGNYNVGDVLSYQPAQPLPIGTTIYVRIVPFNNAGNSVGCQEFSFTTSAVPTCGNPDRPALIALYEATNGENWTINWDTTFCDVCDPTKWPGVICANGRVSAINLESKNLTGQIPPQIAGLTNIESLNLRNNQLSGPIPPAIGQLSNLREIYLHSNSLTGPIPIDLMNLTNLNSLFLYGNQLSGEIPPIFDNLDSLYWLDLDSNQLTGTIPLGIFNLNNLGGLELQINQLNGQIPAEIGRLNNLTKLNLSANHFEGTIPDSIARLANLEYLNLSFNKLSGAIPDELGQLTNLINIELQNNQLSGCFPASLQTFCNGVSYDFSENQSLPGAGDFFGFCNNENPALQTNLDTIVCTNTPVLVGGVPYSAPGNYEIALNAFGGCDSIVNLTLSNFSSGIGNISETLCPDSAIVVHGTVFNQTNPSGQVVLSNAAYQGCDSTIIVSLSFYPAPPIISLGNDFAFCNSTTLTAPAGFSSYQWSNNANTSSIPVTQTGIYSVTATDANGCTSTDAISVQAQSTAQINQSPIICEGESFLVGSSVYTQTGVYTDTLPGAALCDTIVITNLTVAPLAFSTIAEELCAGESIVVNGTVYDAANPSGQETIPGATVLGCDSTVAINLSFLPNATATLQQMLCPDESITVGGVVFDQGNPTGTVSLPGLASNGCDSIVEVQLVFMNDLVQAIDTVLCEGDEFTWNGLLFSSDTDTTIMGSCNGFTQLSIDFLPVDSCDELAPDLLLLSQACIDKIPNFITPDLIDNNNDVFDPIQFLEDCDIVRINDNIVEISIINRWGESVFRRKLGHYQPWDGGKLPQGAYYYHLKIANKGKTYNIRGAVNLIKGF